MGLFDRFTKTIDLPYGNMPVTLYTYDDRHLPDLKVGERLQVEHTARKTKLKSIYTGNVVVSECTFLYKGKPFACIFEDDIINIFKALSKHGKVTCWVNSGGRANAGWLSLSLKIPGFRKLSALVVSLNR